MLRQMGVLMVAGSIGLYGWWRAAQLRQRRELMEGMGRYWEQFALQLGCLRRTPGEIAGLLAGLEEFKRMTFAQKLAETLRGTPDFSWALRQTLSACGLEEDGEVMGALAPLWDTVGRLELEMQQTALRSAIQLFGRGGKRALEREERYAGLYRRLGLLCGCLAAVVLL